MKENIIILVDDTNEKSPYVVCHWSQGRHKILTSGILSTWEELLEIQAQYENASVQIDCAFVGSEIQKAAEYHKWKLLKFKNGDFQFIEAIIQLAAYHGTSEGEMNVNPWQKAPLNEWAICGMNHYHVAGERFLFVSMVKDGRCIREEGKDDEYLWNRLWHKATQQQGG